MRKRRLVLLAEGSFSPEGAKTAVCVVRYRPDEVVAVIDSTRAGKTVAEVLGFGPTAPVVATMAEALAQRSDLLLIGIAPMGGRLPDAWRAMILEAIGAGLDVVSGLHTFLADDPEIASAAAARGVALEDLRRPPDDLNIPTGANKRWVPRVVLTVGTDCNSGKMTTAVEIAQGLRRRGANASWAATGQTGIFLRGKGIAVDRVVSDFVAGAAERLILEATDGADVVIVEGQGSLQHPAYSGVTLGLLHGALPHALVLCHKPPRKSIRNYPEVPLPPLRKVVELYERAAAWVRPARVVAVSLATYDLSEREARAAVARARRDTGLPATDPVRFGVEPILDAVTGKGIGRGRSAPRRRPRARV
ncbi:MAG TPA: DUF1611 domain-containing protein [Planctomycetota bacterium]|nr:DUF1611 domain-containing protein [Planctomycetota bacterium]